MRFASLLAVAVAAGPAGADVVVLEHGTSLVGDLARVPGDARDTLKLRSALGEIVLDRDLVTASVEESPAQADYRRRAPTVSDTIPAQLALAAWCRDNGLAAEHRRHLQRVIRLDPNHAGARRALGFELVDGRWLTRDQRLAARGLIRWQGDFRTAQEIELLERSDKAEAERVVWKKRVARWRRDLGRNREGASERVAEELDALRDPAAGVAIAAWLADESRPAWRRRLVRAIGRLGGPAAFGALVEITLNDDSIDLATEALEQLAAMEVVGVASPFVAALASPDNGTVNRAGAALGRLGASDAVGPLIDALRTTHRQRLRPESQGDTYSMNTATGTFGFGGGGPTVSETTRNNADVLAALAALTGVNHLYDQDRWRAWLAAQQAREPIDLRRDP